MPLPSTPPRIDAVYIKTALGQHEVRHRGAGLTARQRTALIMLDGQREAGVLATVMPADEIAQALAALIARDLIAAVHGDAPPPIAADSGKLAAIKAELIGAAETYLGVMGNDVVARVRQAGDAAQLLRVLGHWSMAMQDSKHGKDVARTLLARSKLQLS